MLFKKKKTHAAPENTEAAGEQKFQKDIKVLWIYTTLFCLFALVLIIVSSVIQGKINSTADYYQDLYEGEKTSSQSTIKNIQTENASLKNAIEVYKTENEQIKEKLEVSNETINTSAQMAENCEYLILAQRETYTGSMAKARSHIEKIDPELLSEDMQEVYEKLCKTLGV